MWYVLGYSQNRARMQDFDLPTDIPESGGSDMGGTQPKDSKNLAGNRNSRLQSEIHWLGIGTQDCSLGFIGWE